MRVLVLGGTWFIGRRVVELLHERGDAVLVVHRGRTTPDDWVPVRHLLTDRSKLADHAATVAEFDPEAVVDTAPLNGADVDAVTPVLPDVPTVALSSQDVYAAFLGLLRNQEVSPLPITEDSPLRSERRLEDEDYEKLEVEERWLDRGATVLRLPMVYGPHDWQRREEVVLRRIRAGRPRIPVGVGNLLWNRGYVDDIARGVLAALDTRAADGMALNLGETAIHTIRGWYEAVVAAAGADTELVTVPDDVVPPDLMLTTARRQHLLVSSAKAERLLGWRHGDPAAALADSVRWHLAHPPESPDTDFTADDAALAAAE